MPVCLLPEEFYLNSGPDRAYLSAYLIPTFLALVFVCASVVNAVRQKTGESRVQRLLSGAGLYFCSFKKYIYLKETKCLELWV